MHDAPAHRREVTGLFQGEHSRCERRCDFSHAMPHHRGWENAKGAVERREGHADREQHRLDDVDPVEQRRLLEEYARISGETVGSADSTFSEKIRKVFK